MIPTICVIGAGRMGSSIARALLSKGYRTAVWSRTLSRCQPLASLGTHHSAFQHLLAACEERGLNAALPRDMDAVFRQGPAEQGSDSDFASRAPLFRRGQMSVASGEQVYA